jgi:hypothetical protein
MATTIAALHLIAVLAVALFTKSRLLSWLAAFGVLYLAFAFGRSDYALMDAISTLIGLGMGLALIGKKAAPSQKTPPDLAPATVSAKRPLSPVSARMDIGPAKEFELHPKPQRRTGWWIGLVLMIILTAVWGFYG